MNKSKIPVLKKIIPQVTEIFTPEGKSLGNANEYELLDFLAQIKELKIEGYYCMYEGQKLIINKHGKIKRPPKGFFDLFDILYKRLI